jgi:PAS domain S-box-containing protein
MAPSALARPRVFVVDDSPLVCSLAEEELTASGYEVCSFTDPVKAVDSLAQLEPAVVVCDLNMPGLSGVEVLAKVRAALPDSPVVIYTESNTVSAAVSALQQGAFRYVVKDAAAAGLAAEVQRAHEQHLVLRRAREAELQNEKYRQELERMVQERTQQLVREHKLRDRQREEHEAQRRQAEARFREVLERWPDPVMVVRDGKLLFVNDSLVALLRYPSRDALVGGDVLAIVHPEEHDEVRQILRQPEPARGPAPRKERRWVRPDGSVVVVEVAPLPVLWEGQQAIMGMARDVTELKQLTAKMMQMDRMVAVGTLAAGVGHEINNPLAYILSNVVFAQSELATVQRMGDVSPEVVRRLSSAGSALQDAQDGAERVRDIVRDLKTFSRGDEPSDEAVDVHAVLDSALALARNEIRHRAAVVKDYGEEVPPVVASRSRLGQVFVNLLVNAAHAIPEGHADRNSIRVTTRLAGEGRVEVSIADTGTGIRPEHLPQIFDPFFTTKRQGEGTGLGLAICAGIIRGLGGEISVQSEVGKGSTFRVVVPVGAAQAVTPEAPPAAPAAAGDGALGDEPRSRWTILVVDDEPMFGVAVRRLLSGKHDVRVAGSGREALDHLVRGERFDAILSDVHMPEMTGIELYETIQQRWPELIPRMGFVTGGAISEEARLFLDQRRERIFEKPGSLMALEAFLARLAQGAAAS